MLGVGLKRKASTLMSVSSNRFQNAEWFSTMEPAKSVSTAIKDMTWSMADVRNMKWPNAATIWHRDSQSKDTQLTLWPMITFGWWQIISPLLVVLLVSPMTLIVMCLSWESEANTKPVSHPRSSKLSQPWSSTTLFLTVCFNLDMKPSVSNATKDIFWDKTEKNVWSTFRIQIAPELTTVTFVSVAMKITFWFLINVWEEPLPTAFNTIQPLKNSFARGVSKTSDHLTIKRAALLETSIIVLIIMTLKKRHVHHAKMKDSTFYTRFQATNFYVSPLSWTWTAKTYCSPMLSIRYRLLNAKCVIPGITRPLITSYLTGLCV